ncbi:polysaccharide deacetylase family protein [Flavobacterium kingsejongi]|uniref:Polysaccharide deacetylase family protein n=1 Tax=Flavobacterium kingsejongi TaxID=1678728 RepID=A0A2S1LJX3_9FLAO|nr:polysaccharide deacetylase family protein [Flavobacterium kingsejongi]AWG24052.1 polysaccharide deacetylase family protein [Flavobacterium kingsejongi]
MDLLWIKTNAFIKAIFFRYTWSIPVSGTNKPVYLTFDDGPTPEITNWVCDQLKAYNAKATFFCIGNNIEKNPQLFDRLIAEKHTIGNHTYSHRKGWQTPTSIYLEEVLKTEEIIRERLGLYNAHSLQKLFRPPYGKIKFSQSSKIRKAGYKIIMWDVLSVDYDRTTTPEKCLQNVLQNVAPGSIIVFHDSIKAFKNLEYVLPETLKFLKENNYEMLEIG